MTPPPSPQADESPDEAIVVRGARVHNLKNISLRIPRNTLAVLTGPSGSGKSSLAFDTIYAEGQRRYVESLSAYARQFLAQMGKPDVDFIGGLSPTISIEQRTTSYNPRSTVGTVTEIYDYLRVLFARIGKPFCYSCRKPIRSQSPQQITDQILAYADATKVSIMAAIVRERKGEYQKELLQLRQQGFVRVRIDGEVLDLSQDIALDRNKKHTIEVYVDRLIIKGDRSALSPRVSESVELGLKLGSGLLVLEVQTGEDTKELLVSEKFACADCEVSYASPEPRSFSFNSPLGACPHCDGLGVELDIKKKPLQDSEGLEEEPPETPCSECHGDRLRIESLHFRVSELNIASVCRLSISECCRFFETLKLNERELMIAGRIIKELRERLLFLCSVGVDYLSLSRSAKSLSGGEAQRIRLATQLGSSLVGVIYVLDEPSIGLHQRDNEKLISTLERLRDLGNTILVVEHDLDTMSRADFLVDLGPGAGRDGGAVVAYGTPKEVSKNSNSITGLYLAGKKRIEVPRTRRPYRSNKGIQIQGASMNNLKSIDCFFPLGLLTCVTGVSGSGKSTLVIDTLYRSLMSHLYGGDAGDLKTRKISGLDLIDKVIDIDQSPIGKTPRSNPATYTGLFGLIRELFSQLPESQVRGYGPGRYSFNVKGGRCDICEGGGMTRVEMHFLPDVFITCAGCQGRRYNRDTLEIRYKGKTISEVLDMTISDAAKFFDAVPSIKPKLRLLDEVGLGYLQLGQSATTLSGGEAQRIKLARELSRRTTGKTFYILDEPSTGLHFDDVKKLLSILQSLVDQGNTVLVIEHNLDIIKVADHIIDLGPEGGGKGGEIVATGTPEEIAAVRASHTGRFLRPYLQGV